VCHVCQKRRRVTVYDCIPITPIPRDDVVFRSWTMDTLGPLFPNQKVKYNYALVLCDSACRFPVAYPLRSLTAKSVCDALMQLFQMTGIRAMVRSDNASNFAGQLTQTFMKNLGMQSVFQCPR